MIASAAIIADNALMKRVTVLFFLFFCAQSAIAQTLTEDQVLSFGTFALKNNSAAHAFIVHRDGSTTADPEYIEILPAQEAIFSVTGCPPNTNVTINIDNASMTLGGGGAGEAFTVDTYTLPPVTQTDGAGNLTFDVGATMTSSGTGTMYTDGGHSDQFDVTIMCP